MFPILYTTTVIIVPWRECRTSDCGDEFHDQMCVFRGLTPRSVMIYGFLPLSHGRPVQLPYFLSSHLLEIPLLSLTTSRMQRAKNADHFAIYSDATYPVGPDKSGRITYVHVPPLSPLTGAHNLFIDLVSHLTSALLAVVIITLACVAIAAFFCCYIYPVVRKCHDDRAAKGRRVKRKRPVLASARSLFGLRPQTPPTTPQLLARCGRPDMRIARPPPALSLARRSWLSPSLSPSLSSSSSSSPSPSPSPTSTETPWIYSPPAISKVVVAPVDRGVLGQTVENRTTPKKGRDCYDEHKAEDN
jgi:hypothetical protein